MSSDRDLLRKLRPSLGTGEWTPLAEFTPHEQERIARFQSRAWVQVCQPAPGSRMVKLTEAGYLAVEEG